MLEHTTKREVSVDQAIKVVRILEEEPIQKITLDYKEPYYEQIFKIEIYIAYQMETEDEDGTYIKEIFWVADVIEPDENEKWNINKHKLGSEKEYFNSFEEAYMESIIFIRSWTR